MPILCMDCEGTGEVGTYIGSGDPVNYGPNDVGSAVCAPCRGTGHVRCSAHMCARLAVAAIEDEGFCADHAREMEAA